MYWFGVASDFSGETWRLDIAMTIGSNLDTAPSLQEHNRRPFETMTRRYLRQRG